MSQGTGTSNRARATTVLLGAAAGSLALAAPAVAGSACTASGQIPSGGLACLTVDTVAGHADQVRGISSTITYKGYYNFQVRMSGPGTSDTALTPRYVSGIDLPNFPHDPNAITTYPFTYCSAFVPGGPGLSNGCGTYPQGSKVWLQVYNDSGSASYKTPAIDVNPAPGCTWKC